MADYELIPTVGAIEKGLAYTSPELSGDTWLYVMQERQGYATYERKDLNVGPFVIKGESGRLAESLAAQEWVHNDWPRLRNYIRWANYMANNPPPG